MSRPPVSRQGAPRSRRRRRRRAMQKRSRGICRGCQRRCRARQKPPMGRPWQNTKGNIGRIRHTGNRQGICHRRPHGDCRNKRRGAKADGTGSRAPDGFHGQGGGGIYATRKGSHAMEAGPAEPIESIHRCIVNIADAYAGYMPGSEAIVVYNGCGMGCSGSSQGRYA